MQLLDYESFWLNDLQTYPFLKALQSSRGFFSPKNLSGTGYLSASWDGLSQGWAIPDPNPQVYKWGKHRMAGQVNLCDLPEEAAAQKDLSKGIWAPNGLLLPTKKERSPAPLLESYLCFSGGSYRRSGYRSRRGGGVSQKGFDRNVRLAHEIMQRTQPRITRLDYRNVLKECGESDVVFLDPPYLGADVRSYTDKTLDHRELVSALLASAITQNRPMSIT